MKAKKTNIFIVFFIFILFAISMVFVMKSMEYYDFDEEKYFTSYNKIVTNKLNNLLKNQTTVDQKINKAIKSKQYTLDNPYVLNNPYGISPLSAIVVFETPKEEEVSVSINDTYVTKVEKSKTHIIPIYGLYANTFNFVTLSTRSKTKTIQIVTESLNYENVDKEKKAVKNQYFLLSDINKKNHLLRGFDKNNNLLFYLDLNNVSTFKILDNHFYIGYNSVFSYDNKESNNDLMVEVDYLGRIHTISNLKNDLLYNYKESNGSVYQRYEYDMYDPIIPNYEIKPVNNKYDNLSNKERVITHDIEKILDAAEVLQDKYSISFNGNEINLTYTKNVKSLELLMIKRNSEFSYKYTFIGKNIHNTKITTDLSGDYSLYLIVDGKYYNLLTTLKN